MGYARVQRLLLSITKIKIYHVLKYFSFSSIIIVETTIIIDQKEIHIF